MVAIAVAIALAAQPGAAYADSVEGRPQLDLAKTPYSPSGFSHSPPSRSLGIYFLWLIAHRTRDQIPTDAGRHKEP